MSHHIKIKHKRKLLKLSLQDLATRVNKSKAHIYDIEEAKTSPSVDTLKDISQALDLPMLYLIDDKYNIGIYPHEPHYCEYCSKIKRIKEMLSE